MKTIFIMSLTGSIIVIAIRLLKPFINKYGLIEWQALLLKLSAVFFMIPMPFMKWFYQGLRRLFIPESSGQSDAILITRKHAAILLSDTKWVVNIPGKIYMEIVVIWLIVAFFILVKYILQYKKYKTLIFIEFPRVSDKELFAMLGSLQKETGINTKIQLYIDPFRKEAFSMGILHPLIVLPANMDKDKLRLILLHELIHIKNKDLLVKGAALLILCIHWFNPLAYLLFKMINESNEICCDKKASKTLSREECRLYCELIIEMATSKQKQILFISPLKGGYKEMKRRLTYLMNENYAPKIVKYLTCFISIFLVVSCSMSEFAYGDPIEVLKMVGQEENLEEQFDGFTHLDIAFAENGVSLPFELNEKILFQEQFIDENGNISEADKTVRNSCSHSVTVDGTYQKHELHNDGSCKIKNYNAKRCKECGTLIIGNFISEAYYPKCIH